MKIQSELNRKHDSFKVATGDNTDRNIKSGEIVFGKIKTRDMHATTIQSITPGPDLYKNTATDYCSFVRQSDDSNSIGSMALKHVKVYGDGRCLFRCIATLLNWPLLLCVRNEGRIPLDPRLENFETNLADILQANTVQTMEADLHFLNILDDPIKKVLCEQQTGQFYSSLEDRLTSMLSHDEYAGELEICGLVYSSCCSILLYQLENGVPQCYSSMVVKNFPNMEPLRILYHPDQPNQPGHYEILVNQYTNIIHIRNTIYETAGTRFATKISFYTEQNWDLSFILFLIFRSSGIWRLKETKIWKSTLLRLKILLVLSHSICLVSNISVLKHCKYIWNAINLRPSFKKHWPLFPLKSRVKRKIF